MNISSVARSYVSGRKFKDILDFRVSKSGLGRTSFPIVNFVLKLCYAIELDDKVKSIEYKDDFNQETQYRFTEKEFLRFLYDNERANLPEQPQSVYNHLIWVNGRRGLKTTTSAEMDLWELWQDLEQECPQVDKYHMLAGSKVRFTNVASSDEQSSIYYSMIQEGLNTAAVFKPFVDQITTEKATFYTKADLKRREDSKLWKSTYEIQTSPCSGRTSRGPGCRCVTFDEFAFFLEALKGKGQASDASVHKAITPSTLSFGEFRRIKELSSPYTQSGLFYTHYKDSINNPLYLMIRLRSFDTNPTLDPKTLHDEFSKDPESYAHEYLAEFTGGKVNYLNKTQVSRVMQPVALSHIRSYYFYWGIDLGLANDGTGIGISHVEEKKVFLDHQSTFYAKRDKYEDKEFLSFEDVISEMVPLLKEFPPRAGVYDQWNGFGFSSFLSKIRLEEKFEMVTFNRQLNSELAKLFKRLVLSNKELVINKDLVELQDELSRVLQINVSKYLSKVEAPPGDHDDATDSALRSVWLAYRKGILGKEIPVTEDPNFEKRQARRVAHRIGRSLSAFRRIGTSHRG